MTTWQNKAPATWDKTQTRLGAHFLQSAPWAAFQAALGKKIFYAAEQDWSWLATLEQGRLGRRLYCPYGPTFTSVESLSEALETLIACAKQNSVTYIRVEPQGTCTESDLRKLGLSRAHRDIQPRLTWVKDLRPSEDQLLAEMTATNRNLHRTAGKKGLRFRSSTDPGDIAIFLGMMHQVAQRNQIQIHPDGYYKKMAEVLMPLGAGKLYISEHQGRPVATSLVFDSPATRYYAHAAARAEARKLHPGTPLVSQMIFDAKRAGQTAFDFYGISPPDQPNHHWAGFTRFKQSFGGHEVDRHGTWELPIKKLPYGLYRTLAKLGR